MRSPFTDRQGVHDESAAGARWGFSSVRPPDARRSLLEHDTLLFESWTPQRESRREHHIVDEAGDEIGRAIELPKLRRWKHVPGIHRGDVRLAIYDSDGIKLLELLRPPGLLRGAAVTDGNGARIGWIAKRKRRRFEFENVLGQRIGTMTRKARRYGVEYEIENSAGTQVGRIVDPARLAAETARGECESTWSHLKGRLNLTNQPNEHLLLIRSHADVDLRLMMLASAAAVYLVLQTPFTSD